MPQPKFPANYPSSLNGSVAFAVLKVYRVYVILVGEQGGKKVKLVAVGCTRNRASSMPVVPYTVYIAHIGRYSFSCNKNSCGLYAELHFDIAPKEVSSILLRWCDWTLPNPFDDGSRLRFLAVNPVK